MMEEDEVSTKKIAPANDAAPTAPMGEASIQKNGADAEQDDGDEDMEDDNVKPVAPG